MYETSFVRPSRIKNSAMMDSLLRSGMLLCCGCTCHQKSWLVVVMPRSIADAMIVVKRLLDVLPNASDEPRRNVLSWCHRNSRDIHRSLSTEACHREVARTLGHDSWLRARPTPGHVVPLPRS